MILGSLYLLIKQTFRGPPKSIFLKWKCMEAFHRGIIIKHFLFFFQNIRSLRRESNIFFLKSSSFLRICLFEYFTKLANDNLRSQLMTFGRFFTTWARFSSNICELFVKIFHSKLSKVTSQSCSSIQKDFANGLSEPVKNSKFLQTVLQGTRYFQEISWESHQKVCKICQELPLGSVGRLTLKP